MKTITVYYILEQSFANSLKLLNVSVQHGSDEGWEKTRCAIDGFKFSGGQNAKTCGIWLWMYPQPVHGVRIITLCWLVDVEN